MSLFRSLSSAKVVTIVGIAITAFSFFLDNSDEYHFLRLLTPKYKRALKGIDRSLDRNERLVVGNIGFDELKELIRPMIGDVSTTTEIASIKVGGSGGVMVISSGRNSGVVALEFVDGHAISNQLLAGSLDELSKAQFFDPVIKRWKSSLFWLGIAISFAGVFL